MSNVSDKSNEIILDVFEIKDYTNPVLKYKISVVDKFIILVSNKDVPSTDTGFVVHDDKIREKLVLDDLTDNEKFDFGSYLTHKFQIRHFSKDLFLNLTDNDLIKLGFKEKQKSFWKKLIDFSINDPWTLFERASIVLGTVVLVAGLNLCHDNNSKKEEGKKENISHHEIGQKKSLPDSINISKTDTLHEK